MNVDGLNGTFDSDNGFIIGTQLNDNTGNAITSANPLPVETSGGASGAGGGNNTYSTEQLDFTATITNATYNIVLSVDAIGGDSITEANIMNGILTVYDDSASEKIAITLDKFTWTSGTKTINTTNCTNAFTFATGDIVSLTLTGPDKAYNESIDFNKTQEQSPITSHETDAEDILGGTAYELTAAFADVGAEIDVRTYNTMVGYFTIDIGTSTAVQIRILYKTASAATEEYRQVYLGTPGANLIAINLTDYNVVTNADQLFKIAIPVEGVAFVQIQARDAAAGDGQIDKLEIIKTWGV